MQTYSFLSSAGAGFIFSVLAAGPLMTNMLSRAQMQETAYAHILYIAPKFPWLHEVSIPQNYKRYIIAAEEDLGKSLKR